MLEPITLMWIHDKKTNIPMREVDEIEDIRSKRHSERQRNLAGNP